ncbi:hypothetical protein NEIPOLOT_00763 [Neisseria polysaccharea ATCC 43768]|nr:hypothetical protein NEIPOLOT_00763 [Neisseria polysaccharea ATCC 43768]
MFHFGFSSFVVRCSFSLFPNKLPYKFFYSGLTKIRTRRRSRRQYK